MNHSFILCERGKSMDDRIKEIADAATMLFIQQGYTKTQISHIAKAVGVSVGTIYLSFAGKKEILHYILKCTIDPEYGEQEFERPIKDTQFEGIEVEIVDMLQKINRDFASHLENEAKDYTLEEMISDAFDILYRYSAGCLFIEKNSFDFPDLAQHYRECRSDFLAAMKQYFEIFVKKGIVREPENLDLSITLIIEILSWWAMDRRFTSFELCDVSEELAKRVCMDNIITAYKNQ